VVLGIFIFDDYQTGNGDAGSEFNGNNDLWLPDWGVLSFSARKREMLSGKEKGSYYEKY
jgi:hypothetical protein